VDEIASRLNLASQGYKEADLISSEAEGEDFIQTCLDFTVRSTI